MVLRTIALKGLSGYPPCDPPREQHQVTSGSNIMGGDGKGNPVKEVLLTRHVILARGIVDMGVGGVRTVEPPIRRTTMDPILAQQRGEVALEAATVDIGMV